MEHTPTPWGISKEGNIISLSKNGGNCLIAKISNPSTPEKKANARLIAAAPELLKEAISNKGFFDIAETQINICIDSFEQWSVADTKRYLSELRHTIGLRSNENSKVISKATGGK